MKNGRYSDAQIMTTLKQAEGGVPVSELCREHGMSSASFYMAGQIWRHGRFIDLRDEGYGGREPSPEAYVC
jgi:transposase-like protein